MGSCKEAVGHVTPVSSDTRDTLEQSDTTADHSDCKHIKDSRSNCCIVSIM